MLDTPRITDSADQWIAFIPLAVLRAEIQTVIGPGIREVLATLADQGIAPAGPWFTHHRRRPSETFDFEICVPVSTPIAAAGRVKPGLLPAARVSRTLYRGPYEGLGAAWGEFLAWVEANRYTSRPDLWECYVVGPESGCDPADYVTELNRPLVG